MPKSTAYTGAGPIVVRQLNKQKKNSTTKLRAMNSKTKRGPGGSFRGIHKKAGK